METAGLAQWELAVRVLAAAILGGAVGFEREYHDQPAGFRTHILVSLGAALFTLIGTYGLEMFSNGTQGSLNLDPSRVTAQIVSGIGFLGAGAILRYGLNVRGLTTAASLWVTAAIGAAVAIGYWWAAGMVTVAVLAALYGLKWVEDNVLHKVKPGRVRFTIEMTPDLRIATLSEVLESHHARVDNMRVESDESGNRLLIAHVALPPQVTAEMLTQEVGDIDGIVTIEHS
jgi:putative Mg2+ transporter-C (MgtC) family protein